MDTTMIIPEEPLPLQVSVGALADAVSVFVADLDRGWGYMTTVDRVVRVRRALNAVEASMGLEPGELAEMERLDAARSTTYGPY